jgi:N-acyl-D-aspartate/D-glutamate deacylase
MNRPAVLLVAGLVAAAACSSGQAPPPSYDLVVANGRVMDPESGLDGVWHIGIPGGTIEAVSVTPLAGSRVIDASHLVVAPGFIDLHEHGQQEESYRMMVRDGVTSAVELEVGTSDVPAWYAAREGGQIVNYGVSVGHISVRMRVLGDPGKGLMPAGIGGSGHADEAQLQQMDALLREGLAHVAMGFGTAYTPGASMSEIERMFRVASEGGVSAHIHLRGGLQGLQETIAAAARAHVALHMAAAASARTQAQRVMARWAAVKAKAAALR